jgi:hypothetical protein
VGGVWGLEFKVVGVERAQTLLALEAFEFQRGLLQELGHGAAVDLDSATFGHLRVILSI